MPIRVDPHSIVTTIPGVWENVTGIVQEHDVESVESKSV